MLNALLSIARRSTPGRNASVLPFRQPRTSGQAESAAQIVAQWKATLKSLPSSLPMLLSQWSNAELICKKQITPVDLLPLREALVAKSLPNGLELRAAFGLALESAAANVPVLDGKTHLALDTSGSMSGAPLRAGALLTASLAYKNPAIQVTLFDSTLRNVSLSEADTLEENCLLLESEVRMSPTNFAEMLTAFSPKATRLILVTDMPYCLEEHSARKAWLAKVEQYKRAGRPVPSLWIVDVTGNSQLPPTHPLPGVTLWNGVNQSLVEALLAEKAQEADKS